MLNVCLIALQNKAEGVSTELRMKSQDVMSLKQKF